MAKTKTRKRAPSFKKAACAPGRQHDQNRSCLNPGDVNKLRLAWNRRHPSRRIRKGSKKAVLSRLRELTKEVCPGEACWASRPFVTSSQTAKRAVSAAHRPMAPRVWLSSPNEWLTSDDIDQVMHQYEVAYPHFVYLGSSPIDFDARPRDRSEKCVWARLCDLSIANELRKGKTEMAVILNADPHYKEGSHWMTLFVNLSQRYIFYFDSTGDPMPAEVKRLVSRLKDEAKSLGLDLDVIESRRRHQRENTECGVYALYAVSELLGGHHTPASLMAKGIPDAEMFRFRKRFFNMPRSGST